MDNQTANTIKPLGSLTIFSIALHGLFSSIGIIENVLILGIVGFQVRRSVISIWILNLAASDLLATASLPVFTHYMASGNTWTLGTTFCRIHSSVFFLNMFVSGFLLAAISMDRCLVVRKPVWAQNHRNVQLAWKVCGVIWALAVVCTIPFYIFRDTIPHDGKILCYYNYARFLPNDTHREGIRKRREDALAFMKLLMAFIIPLLIIILSYAGVNATLARKNYRRNFHFVRLVVAVVVTFVLCWAPYHILFIIEVMANKNHPLQKTVVKALPVAATIGFLNSVLNPILYVFSCPDLCKRIRKSLGDVMESALAEDLVELARRCSTVRGSVELGMRRKHSTATVNTKTEEQELNESVFNSA